MKNHQIAIATAIFTFSLTSWATPSTTYWAPTSATCQSWAVPHLTYDSYFAQGPATGIGGAPGYPTDLGLTSGLLRYEKIQAEAGFDVLYPTQDPLLLNAKICTPESSTFDGSPALGFGIYNVGLKRNVTDMNVLYFMAQKTIPGIGGYIALGGYHGLNKKLLTNSNGDAVQSGLLAALASPDIDIGLKGLKKINFVADIQTGKNILGAWGFGSNIFFAENVSILLGPVFFFDKGLQPGGRNFLWTTQLDVDIPLTR